MNKYITFHRKKQGVIMKKYQNRKNLPVKNHCFLVGKVWFFSEKSGKWRFYQEKSMGKCYKSYGFSVKKACVHILGSVCI